MPASKSMHSIKSLLFILFLLPVMAFSQQVYFKMSDGAYIDFDDYKRIVKTLSEQGDVEESFTRTVIRNDSVIISAQFTAVSIKGGGFDPFKKFKNEIGKPFPFDKFKDELGRPLKAKDFIGKPTMINFWFTKCPPCIKEIPILNQVETAFSNDIQFVAITFDSQELVADFLQKRPINFRHFPNNRTGLQDYNVKGYPMNLILDKSGNIQSVFGSVTHERKELLKLLVDLM